jgi:hypothetical protein
MNIRTRRARRDYEQTDHLLARLELIADAEEQAATAEEQARIASELGPETLSCAAVLTLAIEQIARTHAEICERMAAAAVTEGEVLLARSLGSLGEKLQAAARDAGSAAIEAHDFGQAAAAERPDPQGAETV